MNVKALRSSGVYCSALNRAVKEYGWLCGLDGKSVLITGATGLICSAIVDVILAAMETMKFSCHLTLAGRDIKRLEARFGGESGCISFLRYDALKPFSAERRFDFIIHGASNAHPVLFGKEPIETLMNNVFGTNELLRYARDTGTGRFLFISSSEVYGRIGENRPYREDDYGYIDILNPRSCYPNGKRAAETLCAAYMEQYQTDSVIVRPGHIYGPTASETDSRASACFIRDVSAGKNVHMKSAGLQMRSYCYSTDAATAILCVLLKGKKGEAYNISNSDSVVTVREFAECAARLGGCRVEFEEAAKSEQKWFNLMSNSSLDSEKLESLGWKGMYPLEEGIKETLEVTASVGP